jgi:hypothetical protein
MTKFNSSLEKCLICSNEFYIQPARKKAGRGKYCSKECYFKSKVGKAPWNKGKPAPWVTGEKHPKWNKERPACKECGVPIWRSMTYCKKHANKGERNFGWKGDDAMYGAKHSWVYRELGQPDKCSKCGKNGNGHSMHWANIDHKYRRVHSDWIRLCVACHTEYDKRFN